MTAGPNQQDNVTFEECGGAGAGRVFMKIRMAPLKKGIAVNEHACAKVYM